MDIRPGTGSAEDEAFFSHSCVGYVFYEHLFTFLAVGQDGWGQGEVGGDRGRWVGTEGGGWRQGAQGEVGRFSWRVKTAGLGYRKPWLALSGPFFSSLHEQSSCLV